MRTPRPRRSALLVALALLGTSGCSGDDPNLPPPAGSDAAARAARASTLPLDRQLVDLVAALREDTELPAPGAPDWVERVRLTLARMDHADPDLGRAVLALLAERDDLDPGLRSRLLEAATRAMVHDEGARAEIASELARRVERYEWTLGERNKACELLGKYCPAEAVAVLGPLLVPDRRSTTLPEHEFMLRGYVEASRATGADPSEVLAVVAADPRVDGFSRKLALRELANDPDPRAIAIFETVMVESTGDADLRRAAVQAFARSVPSTRAIAHLELVQVREADPNMQEFLGNVIAELRGER